MREETVVELVILISHLFLIEQPDAVEDFSGPGAHINCIDPLFAVREVKARPSYREWGVGRERDRAPEPAFAHSHHPTAHIIGSRTLQKVDTLPHVVRRNNRMPIHPDNHITVRKSESPIDAGRDNLLWIVHHPYTDSGIRLRQPVDNVAGSIRRHAIGDEDLQLTVWIFLRQCCAQASLDETGLIADRHDDSDIRWTGATLYQSNCHRVRMELMHIPKLFISRTATCPALKAGRGPRRGTMKKLQTECVCLLMRGMFKVTGSMVITNFGIGAGRRRARINS